MTTTRSLTCALAMVVSLLAAATVAASPHAAATSRVGGGPLDRVSTTRWFSPNGDQVQDTVKVGIRLQRRARVSVTVRHERKGWVARRVSLGATKAGWRTWTWNGRTDSGRVVPDGNYVVEVRAVRDGVRDRASTRVKSRRSYTTATGGFTPTWSVSKDTIRPAAGETIEIDAFQRRKESNAYGLTRSYPVVPALVAQHISGAPTVWTWPRDLDPRHRVRTWTATTATGDPVPAGTYMLVVMFTDNFGNTGTRATTVTVLP